MTEAEKELADLIEKESTYAYSSPSKVRYLRIAQSIIARYPQVLAEKVWEGGLQSLEFTGAKVEVFIREVK